MKNAKNKVKAKTGHNSKQQHVNEENSKQKQQQKCCACKDSLTPDTQNQLTCHQCKKTAHYSCYKSSYDRSKAKSFVCDMCKNRKKATSCLICDMAITNQMVKSVEGGNGFVHVKCGVLSPNIQIQSYSQLQMTKKQTQKQKITKSAKCFQCDNQKRGTLICCVSCDCKYHYNCALEKPEQLGEEYTNYLIYGNLEKCIKYEYLLQFLSAKKRLPMKHYLDIPKLKQYPIIIMDHYHNNAFCFCGEFYQKASLIQCDECHRWNHNSCAGLPEIYKGQYQCLGCKTKNIFLKQLKFYQVIQEACKIQKNPQRLDTSSIQFLNAFSFKYSSVLERKIFDSIKQIQKYFAKRQIKKLVIEENMSQQKKRKKIIQLFLCIIYGEEIKKHENQFFKKPEQYKNIFFQISKLNSQMFEPDKAKTIYTLLNLKQKIQAASMYKELDAIKQTLKNFVKKWGSIILGKTNEKQLELAQDISQIQGKFIDFQQQPQFKEDSKKLVEKFGQMMGYNILGQLISKKISVQTIKQIITKIGKIKYYENTNSQISQQQYFGLIIGERKNISQEQKQLLSHLLQNLFQSLNKVHIVYKSMKKQRDLKMFEGKLKQNINKLNKVQVKLNSLEICFVGNQNSFSNARFKHYEQNTIKKKILKLCNIKDHQMKQQNLRDAYKIQEYIKKKNIILSQSQKNTFNAYFGKINFIANILKKGESLQQYMISEQMQNEVNGINGMLDQQQEKLNPSTLYIRLFHILDNWNQQILSTQFIINEVYSNLVITKCKFSLKVIEQKLCQFIRVISKKFEANLFGVQEREKRKISVAQLRKQEKILKYFRIEKQFTKISDLIQKLKKWVNLIPLEESIFGLLEKPQKCSQLIKTIENKFINTTEFDRVSLYVQFNKLLLMKQWCKLTQKMGLISKSKATINAVQTLKMLIDKSGYPQNGLSKKISELQTQSKILNKHIIKFLQKPKIPQHLSSLDELKHISSKMHISQGFLIKSVLQKCNLDVYVETQELDNQIKQFQAFSQDFLIFIEKRSFHQIVSLRRKFIQSCFRIQKIQEYDIFLKKFYTLKCLNFQPPISRQEYFELLNVGGVAAIELQTKTGSLLRAYQAIKRAQNQLSNSGTSIKRRNFANLIPWTDQRYKQLKQDLIVFDPTQLNKLQKARLNNIRLREEYHMIRLKKNQIQKYNSIEAELACSIFNNRDILLQINNMRNQINMYARKIQESITYNHPHVQLLRPQNIFKKQIGTFEAYSNSRMRHPTLQRFEHDYRHYKKSEDIRESHSLENYRNYVQCFNKMSEAACCIPEVLLTRTNEWLTIYQNAIQINDPHEFLAHRYVYNLLINEGLELKRLDSPQKDKIFERVFQIYEKIKKNQQEIREQSENEISNEDDGQQLQQDEENYEQGHKRPRRKIQGKDSSDHLQKDNDISNLSQDQDQDLQDEQNYQLNDQEDDNEYQQSSEPDNSKENKNNDQIVLDSD